MKNKYSAFSDELKSTAPQMPGDMKQRFDSTVAEFGIKKIKQRSPAFSALKFAAVFLILAFLILPNVSTTVSYALQEIPVIGKIVKVITIREKYVDDENYFEYINVPTLLYGDETADSDKYVIDYINADISELTAAVIAEFEEERKENPEVYSGISIDYEVVTNTDTWFTLKLILYYSSASSDTEYKFYHINKTTGKPVVLSELFENEFDYIDVFSEDIKNQMKDKVAENKDFIYWLYPEDDYGFSKIDENQNFYFTDEGDIVLVFNKYEIAPGYMGTPEFKIDSEKFGKYVR